LVWASSRIGSVMRGPEIAELLDLQLANVQQILSRHWSDGDPILVAGAGG
jgi:hypothetical protein